MGPIGSVLFAAGRGVRLRPLTDLVPKAAVPILDLPLGAFALARLVRTAPPVVVNVSHLGERVNSLLEPFNAASRSRSAAQPDHPATARPVEFLDEGDTPPGSGGTLANLATRVRDRVLTHNSDALTDLTLSDLLGRHRELGAAATLAVAEVSEGADLEIDGARVGRFVNRKLEPAVAGARFIGVAVFEKAALARIREERPIDAARALLRPLAKSGDLAVHVHRGYWIDVGTPARYLQASVDALNGLVRGDHRPPGRVIEVLGGRAYVGPDAKVDEDQLRPDAIVLAGATVAPDTTIERSVVWPGAEVPGGLPLKNCVWTPLGRVDV